MQEYAIMCANQEVQIMVCMLDVNKKSSGEMSSEIK